MRVVPVPQTARLAKLDSDYKVINVTLVLLELSFKDKIVYHAQITVLLVPAIPCARLARLDLDYKAINVRPAPLILISAAKTANVREYLMTCEA